MRISQEYLCSTCGSVLKETTEYIEICSLGEEECPNCGASLAESLITKKKKELQQNHHQQQQQHTTNIEPKLASFPKIQTAYDLMKFKYDIPKIDSFMPLATSGLLCVVGYKEANLLLTRLCVRALLPSKHGGLDSPYVIVVDAGNKSDVYQTVNFARQYGMDFRKVLNSIIVTRTFTLHQLKSIILSGELTKAIQKHQAGIVAIPGLLDLFDDPNIKQKEAKRIIGRIMKSLDATSSKLLVIISIQENNKYTRLVSASRATTTINQIRLINAKYGRLNTDLYDQGNRKKSISLTEKEMKIVQRR
jgi:transcription initiation factor TFIIIB Brf1 subunit/transcription initiation factor TFIIB